MWCSAAPGPRRVREDRPRKITSPRDHRLADSMSRPRERSPASTSRRSSRQPLEMLEKTRSSDSVARTRRRHDESSISCSPTMRRPPTGAGGHAVPEIVDRERKRSGSSTSSCVLASSASRSRLCFITVPSSATGARPREHFVRRRCQQRQGERGRARQCNRSASRSAPMRDQLRADRRLGGAASHHADQSARNRSRDSTLSRTPVRLRCDDLIEAVSAWCAIESRAASSRRQLGDAAAPRSSMT